MYECENGERGVGRDGGTHTVDVKGRKSVSVGGGRFYRGLSTICLNILLFTLHPTLDVTYHRFHLLPSSLPEIPYFVIASCCPVLPRLAPRVEIVGLVSGCACFFAGDDELVDRCCVLVVEARMRRIDVYPSSMSAFWSSIALRATCLCIYIYTLYIHVSFAETSAVGASLRPSFC